MCEPSWALQLLSMRMCSGHPFVVQLLEVFRTANHLAVVMEIADGGASCHQCTSTRVALRRTWSGNPYLAHGKQQLCT